VLGEPWPLAWSILGLVASALVLVGAGVRFARLADQIADRTGIGEALAGAVLLGATTSLPGIITTGVAAGAGQADLSVSNALGGIAAQTTFLAIADMSYSRANLEHAAASLPNLLQTIALMGLIGLVVVGAGSPGLTLADRVHPVTLLLPAAYLGCLVLTRRVQSHPMWRPRQTDETREDLPDPDAERAPLRSLVARFVVLASLVAGSGFVVARAGLSLVAESGLSGSFVGGVFTSVVTSLPELVTAIAAVRAGAFALALGDIIGGNTFDVLFLVVADLAFAGGSVYGAIGSATLFLLGLTLVLTALLAAGLVYRQKRGIGFEGFFMFGCYAVGMATVYFI